MQPRHAAALLAVAALVLARPAQAAPIGASIASLANNARFFQTVVAAIQQSEAARLDQRRPDGGRAKDSSSGNLVPGFGAGTAGYVAGGAVVVGVVAAFVFNNGSGDARIDADNPIVQQPDQPTTPRNEGDPNGQVLPDLPVTDQTTVTPEPGALLLIGTGLSSLGAVSYRRRRK